MPGRRRPAAAEVEAGLRRIAADGASAAGGDADAAARLLHDCTGTGSPLWAEAAARAVGRAAAAAGGILPGAVDATGALLQAMAAATAGATVDPGCRIRLESVRALQHLRPPAARVEAALRVAVATRQREMVGFGLEDTAVSLRAAAALLLAELGCDCLPDLGLLLFDGLPDERGRDETAVAREAAARAIGLLAQPGGEALLAVRLREPREADEVLAACVDALCAMGAPRAAQWIWPLLDQPRPAAVAAATALCALCPAEAVAAIAIRVPAAATELAVALTTAIAAARCAEAVPCLRRLRDDGRTAVAAAAAAALGDRG